MSNYKKYTLIFIVYNGKKRKAYKYRIFSRYFDRYSKRLTERVKAENPYNTAIFLAVYDGGVQIKNVRV